MDVQVFDEWMGFRVFRRFLHIKEEDLAPEETEALEIAQMVEQIKKDAEVTVKYMKQWEKLQKVYHDGQRERSIEDVMELLEDYGVIPEELHEKILSEQDPDTLKRWHKLAAKVSSIEEFVAKMSKYSMLFFNQLIGSPAYSFPLGGIISIL